MEKKLIFHNHIFVIYQSNLMQLDLHRECLRYAINFFASIKKTLHSKHFIHRYMVKITIYNWERKDFNTEKTGLVDLPLDPLNFVVIQSPRSVWL